MSSFDERLEEELKKSFAVDVSLTDVLVASIAGIVKAPPTYNPATNYENNKARQEVVLTQMADLGFISQEECDKAIATNLKVDIGTVKKNDAEEKISTYFVDAVIADVVADLMEKENLTEGEATNRLYTGGFKIYSTMDPKVQNAIDDVYSKKSNFPGSGANTPQSAMIVMDPYTGHIKGMAGGVGEKTVNRGFNAATDAKRQPGSTMKPIAAYAPAAPPQPKSGYIPPSLWHLTPRPYPCVAAVQYVRFCSSLNRSVLKSFKVSAFISLKVRTPSKNLI